MLKRFILLLNILAISHSSQAQDWHLLDQNLAWLGGKFEVKAPHDWSFYLKLEERRFVFPDRQQQRVIPDLAASKAFGSRWKASAGLWVFSIFQPGSAFEQVETVIHEWRPYFDVTHKIPWSKSSLGISLKSELRMLKEASSKHHFDQDFEQQTWRERLKIAYTYNINPNLKLTAGEEILLNLTSNEVIPLFDQNRLFANISTQLFDNLDLKTGYLHWFQPTNLHNTYFSRHILTLELIYSLSLKE